MPENLSEQFSSNMVMVSAILILLQGEEYSRMGYCLFKKHGCAEFNSDFVNASSFVFMVDLIYFTHRGCTPPTIHIPGQDLNIQLQIDYSKAEAISNRAYIIIMLYIVISTSWMVTSFFVLFTLCARPPKIVILILFGSWFLCITIGCILDVVATGYHIKDILHTRTAKSTFKYIGIKYNEKVLTFLKDYHDLIVAPAVTLTCYSSRIGLFWLLNIIGAIYSILWCRKLIRNVSNDSTHHNRRLPGESVASRRGSDLHVPDKRRRRSSHHMANDIKE